MYDLLIIGAGPAGLSCAIHAKKAKLKYAILDKGTVVDSIYRFPTEMVFFSTPELLEIGDMPFVTSGFRPTRVEVLNYYHRVAEHFELMIRQHERVDSIERRSGLFRVLTSKKRIYQTRNLVFATGYFDNPRRLGVKGEELPKVSHYFDDPYPFFGSRVAVVGGKNSAVETALALHRHGAHVTLVHRGSALSRGVKYWILPDIENRIKEGAIETCFESTVNEIREDSVVVENKRGRRRIIKNDFLFVQIGYDPTTELLKSLGVKVDTGSLVPKHNPRTMETNVRGVYLAGSIAAGKENNKIFIENGRLHGGLIVKSILSKR
ncbi:MAG: YpdA family putative bacillithiol disulfide reductase [Bacteroidota bacterium]